MNRTNWVSWALGLAVAVGITLPPYVYYRMSYEYQKRLRVVTAGKLYRSGCMTSSGLEAAIKTHSIRTVINLMEESPDPVLRRHYWGWASDKESDIVARTGARYLQMTVKYLPRNKAPFERPQTIERYLEILDDPASYPVLVHCKAGLHRTGVLIALYRMEYEGWSREQALAEMAPTASASSPARPRMSTCSSTFLAIDRTFARPRPRCACPPASWCPDPGLNSQAPWHRCPRIDESCSRSWTDN